MARRPGREALQVAVTDTAAAPAAWHAELLHKGRITLARATLQRATDDR
jgi:hypothetical protein